MQADHLQYTIMRTLLSLSLLVLASFDLHAQQLCAGLRANASYRLRPVNHYGFELETAYGDHLSVAPEVFVRFNSKKRWAFEASFNRSTYRPPDFSAQYYELGQPYDTASSKFKADYNELTVSGFYELMCPRLSRSSFFRRMHNYVGLSIGVVSMNYKSANYYEGGWGCFGGGRIAAGYADYEGRETKAWTGINHSLSFDLGKKVKLVSSSYFRFRPDIMLSNFGFWSPYTQAAQFGVQLGAAYRIY